MSTGAEPGDLLVVDILDIGALPESLWGFNGFFSKKNGGGFLTDHFPQAQKSIWDVHGMFTKSRHVPGVSFAGIIHPGLIGCLPSKLLETWNARETGFIATNPDARAAARQPALRRDRAYGADEGRCEKGRRPPAPAPCRRASMAAIATSRICRAARACSSRSMSKGAGLSMGDLHFSQGDGEITFCGAIEMAGWLDLKVGLIKDGMAKYGIKNPIFKPSPMSPTTRTISSSKASRSTSKGSSIISTCTSPIARPASTPSST